MELLSPSKQKKEEARWPLFSALLFQFRKLSHRKRKNLVLGDKETFFLFPTGDTF